MNKEQIEKRIRTINVIIEDNKQYILLYEEQLGNLQAMLAEAEKPELRHGEIRQWPHCIGIVDTSEPHTHLIWADGNKRTPCTSEAAIWDDSKAIGNLRDIFDDLTALLEPLKEFQLDATYISGCLKDGRITLTDRNEESSLSLTKGRELVSYLQRLVHTAEQAKNDS